MKIELHIYHHNDNRQCDRLFAQIQTQLTEIMSAISDFATKQNAHNDAIDAAVSGLTTDVADLKAQIAALQSSAGQITPEDQSLLDDIETRAAGIADKLAALDAQTEQAPAPPVG